MTESEAVTLIVTRSGRLKELLGMDAPLALVRRERSILRRAVLMWNDIVLGDADTQTDGRKVH